jgi:uncharacterized protein YecE (DUF72 family)
MAVTDTFRSVTVDDGHGAMTGSARIGTSGWSYRDWRGVVYPDGLPARRWFEHYQELFDTVELNSTFYRLPAQGTVDKWAAAARPGFIYAVKLGAFGSHRMKLRDGSRWLPNHLDRARRLGEHLGPNLIQLPPTWKRDVARLEDFLAIVPTDLRWAVELREPTWLHDDVFEVLQRHGVALCVHDLLHDHPVERTADWMYVRFHGPDAWQQPYLGRYGVERLVPWVRRLADVLEAGHDVYAYFNNDWHGHAVADARILRTALAEAGVNPAPGERPP